MELYWENEGWETRDRHLTQMAAMPFQRQIPFIPNKPGLYIIRGPRQVGKSSWLKQILRHCARRERCFYLSCEEVENYKELAEILRSVQDRKVVLLDEVNFVKDWDRAVKHAVDSGLTNILVLTGSHAYDLKQGADRMPGRFDQGGEFELLPMDFAEFSAARTQAGWALKNRLEELQLYFRVGGFPAAVAEAGPEGNRPVEAIKTYWRWLSGDVARLGRQESYLKEVLLQLALTLQTPVSFQSLAAKTRFGSHNTLQEYVAILESCFAVRALLAVDLDTGAFRFRKNRKFYFTDPLIYWLALDLGSERVPTDVDARLAEMVAHEELSRRHRRFGYFSNPSGEIDFILPRQWAVEVKWSPVATNLSRTYHSTPLPWKRVWTPRNFLEEFPPQ